jgi:hypothetical protein
VGIITRIFGKKKSELGQPSVVLNIPPDEEYGMVRVKYRAIILNDIMNNPEKLNIWRQNTRKQQEKILNYMIDNKLAGIDSKKKKGKR